MTESIRRLSAIFKVGPLDIGFAHLSMISISRSISAAGVLVAMAFAQSGIVLAESRVGTHPLAVLFGFVPVIVVALGVLVVVIVRRVRSNIGGAGGGSSVPSMTEGARPGAKE